MKNWSNSVPIVGMAVFITAIFWLILFSHPGIVKWNLLGIGVALLIFSAILNNKRIKLFLATKSFKYSSNTFLMIIFVIGIVGLLNYIFSKHNYRFDTTKDKTFSLSKQSQKIVQALNVDIYAKAFFKPGDDVEIKELLSQYRYYSDRFKYEIIDPDAFPNLVKQYNIKNYGTTVFEYVGRVEKINNQSEKSITNVLVKITRDGVKKIYFSLRHGERSIDDINPEGFGEAKTGLQQDNYDTENIFLAEHQSLPDDCALLILAGLKNDLLDSEYRLIQNYLEVGGKMLVLVDPDQPDLSKLLSKWGIIVGDNTVIDTSPIGQLAGAGYASPLINNYLPSEITDNFEMMTVYRLARSVKSSASGDSNLIVHSLAQTSEFPASWGEINLNAEEIQFDEGNDEKGPISIAVSCEKVVPLKADTANAQTGGQKTRIVVFGDSDFASNAFFHFQGNGDLFLNVVNWLTEESDLIAIRDKELKDNRLSLSVQQAQIIFWFGVIFLPLAILIAGIVTYFQNR